MSYLGSQRDKFPLLNPLPGGLRPNRTKLTWALSGGLGRFWAAFSRFFCSCFATSFVVSIFHRFLLILGGSWDRFGMLLARFRDLQGLILSSPELLQEVAEQPKRRTFRTSAESCPRTIREDSENQIQRTAQPTRSSTDRQETKERRSSRSELNNI